MTAEKRRHIRIDSKNLSYVCVDEQGSVVNEGMGRTLNISESGILLEANFCADVDKKVSLTLALEEELVDIGGRVVHCRFADSDKYETGIQFVDMDDNALAMVKRFIALFRRKKAEEGDQKAG